MRSSINKILEIVKSLYFSRFPPYVVFFVTARCNARCKMCFYWRHIETAASTSELSLNEIKQISLNMPRFFSLALSGGEPFLRHDLAEICGYFVRHNQIRHLSIPTNGLLTAAIIQQVGVICEQAPKTRVEIEFSLDGPAEIHDHIRGVPDIFTTALKSLKELLKLEKSYSNLKIKINTTFSNYNQNHLKEFIDFLKNNLKIDRTNISLLHGEARIKEAENYDLELYQNIINYLTDRQIVSPELSWFDLILISIKDRARRLLIKVAREKKYPIRCRALKKFIVIREDGQIFPCEPINNPIGNLRSHHYSIERLLASVEGKNYQKTFNPQNCYCTWGCSILNNVLYSPGELLKIFFISLKYKFKKIK